MVKIITDSSCDLREIRLVYDRNGEVVQFDKAPLTIRIGEREFVDDDNLDVAEMMQAMKAYDGPTSSACPAPGTWCDAFADADEIYVITITSALSGVYNSAMVAREMVLEEHPEKKIHVIDSLSTGPEMELLVRELLKEIATGSSFEEICEHITAYQKRTKLAFVLHCMDNLVKNGRVSKIAGFAASLLGISVVGRASKKGELEMVTKCRGNNKATTSVIEEMKAQGYDGGLVSITHCFNEKAALQIRDRIRKEYPDAEISIMPTRGLCSYYAEEEGVLIGYETKLKEFSLSGVFSKSEQEKAYQEA